MKLNNQAVNNPLGTMGDGEAGAYPRTQGGVHPGHPSHSHSNTMDTLDMQISLHAGKLSTRKKTSQHGENMPTPHTQGSCRNRTPNPGSMTQTCQPLNHHVHPRLCTCTAQKRHLERTATDQSRYKPFTR